MSMSMYTQTKLISWHTLNVFHFIRRRKSSRTHNLWERRFLVSVVAWTGELFELCTVCFRYSLLYAIAAMCPSSLNCSEPVNSVLCKCKLLIYITDISRGKKRWFMCPNDGMPLHGFNIFITESPSNIEKYKIRKMYKIYTQTKKKPYVFNRGWIYNAIGKCWGRFNAFRRLCFSVILFVCCWFFCFGDFCSNRFFFSLLMCN